MIIPYINDKQTFNKIQLLYIIMHLPSQTNKKNKIKFFMNSTTTVTCEQYRCYSKLSTVLLLLYLVNSTAATIRVNSNEHKKNNKFNASLVTTLATNNMFNPNTC